MRRRQRTKLLALLLSLSFITGSVGMTVSASEADSVSADIVVSESGDKMQEEAESADPAGSGEARPENTGGAGLHAGQDTEQDIEQDIEENTDQNIDDGKGSDAIDAIEEQDAEAVTEESLAEEDADAAREAADSGAGEDGSQGTGNDLQAAEGSDPENADPNSAAAAEQKKTAEDLGPAGDAGIETSLSASEMEIYAGRTGELTLEVRFTAGSEEAVQAIADSITWSTKEDQETVAAQVQSVTEPVIVTENEPAAAEGTGSESTETAAEGAPEPDQGTQAQSAEGAPQEISGTITQKAVISGRQEGESVILVSAGDSTQACAVKVSPLAVTLGKCTNLRWDSTTILRWNAVNNTKKYNVTVSLAANGNVYTKSVNVGGKIYVDLEDQINALIKANKASLTGAAYTVTASVQAITMDPVHFKNGPIVKAPTLRYLQTTYLESASRNGWFLRGGGWYYYSAGVKQTGWMIFQNKRYYLDNNGRMLANCWVGNRYLKESGEMARNEWVDGYRYFVDADGLKAEKVSFGTKNWVKDKKGWRYKKADGTFFKNTWKAIGHRTYYFDKDGYVKTGWLTQNGKKYLLNGSGNIVTGYGAMRTGWVKVGGYYYWFDDTGAMVTKNWVDKKQYYVNAAGHRVGWITYANLRNVGTSNRLGYYIGRKGSAPEQSIAAYDEAYKAGNRIMVIDLLFTKDNVPVCLHDNEVKYARMKDGSEPSKRPVVSALTLKQLGQYDFGIKWGQKYKGTPVLTLEQMAKWIKSHPDTEVYIEVKGTTMNAAQIKAATTILDKYKITDRSSMIFSVSKTTDTRAQRVHKASPKLRIGITTASVGTVALQQLSQAKGADNEVFLWCWKTTAMNASIVNKLRSMDVQFECGTMDTLSDVLDYYNKGSAYIYNTGIETDGAVFHKQLSTATCHDKAKWVSTAKGWKYKQIDTSYARNKWLTIAGSRYHFNKDGIMQTGWLNLGGKMYYLNAKGAMVTGTVTIAKHVYEFDANGVMVRKIK